MCRDYFLNIPSILFPSSTLPSCSALNQFQQLNSMLTALGERRPKQKSENKDTKPRLMSF